MSLLTLRNFVQIYFEPKLNEKVATSLQKLSSKDIFEVIDFSENGFMKSLKKTSFPFKSFFNAESEPFTVLSFEEYEHNRKSKKNIE